jgi:hypothetical protein
METPKQHEHVLTKRLGLVLWIVYWLVFLEVVWIHLHHLKHVCLLIHKDSCLPRDRGQRWNLCHFVGWNMNNPPTCVHVYNSWACKQTTDKKNRYRKINLVWFTQINENLLQMTKYWILNDRLPFTLNQSTQARWSTYSVNAQQYVKHNTCSHKAPNYERRRRGGSEIESQKIQSCTMKHQKQKTWVQYILELYGNLQGTVMHTPSTLQHHE